MNRPEWLTRDRLVVVLAVLAPFIVTFGSLSLFRGLAQVISGAATINLHTDELGHLWDTIWIIPVPTMSGSARPDPAA